MVNKFSHFESIARRAYIFTEKEALAESLHPFDVRNIHQKFPKIVKKLFDDGHFSQATFEAFKFLDKEIQRHAKSSEAGFKLMMQVFNDASPVLHLTALSGTSGKDEQKGYQFLFAGGVLAIRNPRGHESIKDDPDICLDHLSFASMLLRRLSDFGYK